MFKYFTEIYLDVATGSSLTKFQVTDLHHIYKAII